MIPGTALVACGYATSVWGAVTLMAVSVGSSGFANSGFISNYLEVKTPDHKPQTRNPAPWTGDLRTRALSSNYLEVNPEFMLKINFRV
jgi:hypothetical protein